MSLYGKKWENGDIIIIRVDLDRCCISYQINKDDYGIAFENIRMLYKKYKIGVSFHDTNDQVKLKHYQKLSQGPPIIGESKVF